MPHPTLQHFEFQHLPPALADISKQFAPVAHLIAALPGNAQREHALQRLLESKDAAVRAAREGGLV